MRNIILVGFMGTGKTVVSKAIAEKLNKTYVSTDGLIGERERRTINDIFAKKGEKYFRKVERSVIKEVCEKDDQVIDAGGGSIIDPENLYTFKKNGIVICLWADPETILERVSNYTHRPLLNVDNPQRRIENLLEFRRYFYERADLHVDTTTGDIPAIVDQIIKSVERERETYLQKAEVESRSRLWELLLTRLFDSADSPIMVADSRGEVVFANVKFQDFFGITGEGLLGKSWIDMVVPEAARAQVFERFKRILKNKNTCQFETPVLDGKRKEKYFYWIATPLKERLGLFVMFIGRPVDHPRRKMSDIYPATNMEIVDVIFSGSKKNEPETAKHSLRVMLFAVSLAKRINMSEEELETLKIAALLHDIGKLAVDERILFKKGELEEHEFEEIKKHPGWSVDMIRPVFSLDPILTVVISHHENYDGSGYPRGIKGEEIPLGARILSIADIYEALITDRIYRKAFTKEQAVKIMEDAKGWKLDPKLTDIFLDMVRNNKLEEDIG